MNVSGLTDRQKQSLMDLLVLGMYTDGHLALAEDARVQKFVDSMQFASEHARKQFVDASIARTTQRTASADAIRNLAGEVAKEFPKPEERKQAYEALNDLLNSDNRVTDRERQFLATVQAILQN